jgi:hypothetical protein
VLESIDGFSIAPEQKFRMRIVRAHLDYIEASIADVDRMLDSIKELARASFVMFESDMTNLLSPSLT